MAKQKQITVIRGSLKNKRIALPEPIHGHQNATPQKIKEALFSILDARGIVPEETIFCDLFAGSGQVGIEALSIGYSFVHFCEWDVKRNANVIHWLKNHYSKNNWKIWRMDAFLFLSRFSTFLHKEEKLVKNLVFFADPPYTFRRNQKNVFEVFLESFRRVNFPAQKVIFMMQVPTKLKHFLPHDDVKQVESNLTRRSEKIYPYGKNKLYYFTKESFDETEI
ncbi:MAG: hypothetical protein D6767_01005 [Candidatus Hydrogenedentota bacterium]|nr:MAG: hypothetical protein D6767_01005 [Candidatus Hydrogenedentota bacterium]